MSPRHVPETRPCDKFEYMSHDATWRCNAMPPRQNRVHVTRCDLRLHSSPPSYIHREGRDWLICRLVAATCRTSMSHEATECACNIRSLRRVAWIQTDLNSCDTSQGHVAATCCTKKYMSHEAYCRGDTVAGTCRGDMSPRVTGP